MPVCRRAQPKQGTAIGLCHRLTSEPDRPDSIGHLELAGRLGASDGEAAVSDRGAVVIPSANAVGSFKESNRAGGSRGENCPSHGRIHRWDIEAVVSRNVASERATRASVVGVQVRRYFCLSENAGRARNQGGETQDSAELHQERLSFLKV